MKNILYVAVYGTCGYAISAKYFIGDEKEDNKKLNVIGINQTFYFIDDLYCVRILFLAK